MEHHLHLPRQLPRTLYVQTAKSIELLGGKWNRSFAAHVFAGDCAERVDEAVIAGEVTDFKKLYQFYETPPELARRMVAMADVRPGQCVLEPSAGRGALLKAQSAKYREIYDRLAGKLGGFTGIWTLIAQCAIELAKQHPQE